jgi:hypothetical protein
LFADRTDDIYIDTEKETVKMPGEQEQTLFEMLGDLVSDGITKIFQNNDKKDEDEAEDDGEEEYEEETYEVQQTESGDNNKVGHADSRTVAVDGDEHRGVETGNVVTECMLVQNCPNSDVSTHTGRENGTDDFFLKILRHSLQSQEK